MISIEFWIIFAIILVIIELYTNSFYLLSIALASLSAAILQYFSYDIWMVLSGFIIVSILCIILTRKLSYNRRSIKYYSNTEQLIGKHAIVTKAIAKKQNGQVIVDGQKWLATSDNSIDKESSVEIIGISSTRLVVKKVSEE